MGEGTIGVKTSPEEIEREVQSIRDGMGPVLSELDHRRHDLTDWRLQLRRRGPALLKTLGAVAGFVTVVQLVKRRRASRQKRRIAAQSAIW